MSSISLSAGILGSSLFTGGVLETHAAEKIEQTTNANKVMDLSIKQLRPGVWIHTSAGIVGKNRIPANGLILETSKGLVLIDTPWNDKLTKQLLQKLKKQFPNKKVTDAIVTHYHNDRIGGIKTLISNAVKVHSTALTADLAYQQHHDKVNNPLGDLKDFTDMQFGDLKLETFYPGKGHTEDNITVWLPKYKILFGGCLIKSLSTKEIVYTPGSYLTDWSQSIKEVEKKYKHINLIVPGHEETGDKNLFAHTLDLIKEKIKENS
ncbi:subclass B1 metallo-beta-lactamase [Bacillus thuringiensis serovar yunnanensis]|nr:subclass B1 metallo-beta-lactamase [Bacillus thuringiensis serovar yunnanensis]